MNLWNTFSRLLLAGVSLLMAAFSATGAMSQSASQSAPQGATQTANQPDYTIRTSTERVLVNVVVRDKHGNFVPGLSRSDFSVSEDGKSQAIASVDVENTDAVVSPLTLQGGLLRAPQVAAAGASKPEAAPSLSSDLKDRRLIILFFDLSSMQPEEIDRASTAAMQYVEKQMAPADLVSVVSLANALRVDQDFTSDRDQLKKVLQAFGLGSGQGFEAGSTGATEGTPDTGQAFTADDTEFNIFNTDRRLQALRSLAEGLSRVEQKKSLLYFSSGMDRTGIENQSELRSAINAAVRANLSIYTVDIRGLQAMTPGGDAQQASLRGVAPYSGKSTLNQYDSNFATQETLVTLAGDTGGHAFLDSNDFQPAFRRVQEDTSTYYVLSYQSSNSARDGKFRKINVRVNRPEVKLDFRRGYYAPADFQHASKEDREQQLEEQLNSDLPSTDFPIYLSTGYFRLAENKFFVPVSLVIPGSEIPFVRASDQDRATLDIIGTVTEAESKRPFPVGSIRDTVKLAVNTAQQVQRKNVQYDSSFVLPPGKYHLKVVVRENRTGRMASFETDLAVPDMKTMPLRISSVILASQKQSAKPRKDDPLVREGTELIPNVTHVFSSSQHLYVYYEVYDPGRQTVDAAGVSPKSAGKSAIRMLTSVAFLKGNVKVYETPLAETDDVNVPDRKAARFQVDVPLQQLPPGFYTCQVNVVDDNAGRFVFPRLALLLR
jgi:VWFA-related protein